MDFLNSYAELIEDQLKEIDYPSKPETLYEPQRYILANGGKRIRPVLALLSCGLCNREVTRAIPTALAVELLHNFTLMHDDIMDQAESRRGVPAVHVKWDSATAILAGDSMLVNSLLQLQKLPDNVDHKKMIRIFLEGINLVCEGQALDMEFEKRSTVTRGDYLEMIEGKTAALISTAMQMGGMCGNATEGQLEYLDTMGRSLGRAFQIQDDWLDVVGDPDKFGKRKAGDIYEGKKTFLMLTALERCNEAEKRKIAGYLSQKPLTSSQVEEVIDIFKKYKVTVDTRELFLSYYNQAEKALQQFGESNYKRDLQHLIKYLKNRER